MESTDIAVELTRGDLQHVWEWACARNELKERSGVATKKVSHKGDVHTHYIGLKAEYAFWKLYGISPDTENRLSGDSFDFILPGGYTTDIKVSRRDLFMFPRMLKSSVLILANPLTAPSKDAHGEDVMPERDPFIPQDDIFGWSHVRFVGWSGRSEFLEHAREVVLKKDPVLLMRREDLLPMWRISNWMAKNGHPPI